MCQTFTSASVSKCFSTDQKRNSTVLHLLFSTGFPKTMGQKSQGTQGNFEFSTISAASTAIITILYICLLVYRAIARERGSNSKNGHEELWWATYNTMAKANLRERFYQRHLGARRLSHQRERQKLFCHCQTNFGEHFISALSGFRLHSNHLSQRERQE